MIQCKKTGSPARPLVIIPARNEAATIADVVNGVRSQAGWEVVVVDDASTDNTAELAALSGARVISLPFRLGAWRAIQTGLRYASEGGWQVVVTMDADGQHRAESLEEVTKPAARGISDVVIGVCPQRASGARRLAWAFFRRLTGLKLQDITSGLRAYNRDAVTVLLSDEAALLRYQDVGVLLLLRFRGLHVSEVRVDMRVRKDGCSRTYSSWWAVMKYMAETLLIAVAKGPGSPPARVYTEAPLEDRVL